MTWFPPADPPIRVQSPEALGRAPVVNEAMTREALIARLVAKREAVDAKWDPYTVRSEREVKARHARTELAVTLIVDEVLGELSLGEETP